MSLHEAMLELADSMDADARSISDGKIMSVGSLLISYAKQIRLLVKASSSESIVTHQEVIPPIVQKAMDRQQSRLSEAGRLANMEERLSQEMGESLIEFIGGNMDGTFAPMQGIPPVGARTRISGQEYVYKEDKKFHYTSR